MSMQSAIALNGANRNQTLAEMLALQPLEGIGRARWRLNAIRRAKKVMACALGRAALFEIQRLPLFPSAPH
jgi:hypothetical protein